MGLLHTGSAYVTKVGLPGSGYEDIKKAQISSQINELRRQENQLYAKFGFSSWESFMAGIKRLTSTHMRDWNVLRRFTSGNLQKYLQKYLPKQYMGDQTLEIHLSTNLSYGQVRDIFNSSGGGEGIKWSMSSKGEVVFKAGWDVKLFKSLVNQIEERKNFQKGKGKFDPNSNDSTALIQYVQSNAQNLIILGDRAQSVADFRATNRTPFGYTQEYFKSMGYGLDKKAMAGYHGADLLQALHTQQEGYNKAKPALENLILNELGSGASPELQEAIREVWHQRDLTAMFQTGENLKGRTGPFGELQTAIFFQYLTKITNSTFSGYLTRIIGNNVNKYGEQLRTDVDFFKALGIQVKNYGDKEGYNEGSGTVEEKTIDVNLHLSQISILQTAMNYILNSYFNSSVPQISEGELKAFCERNAMHLLNLNLQPNIPDQVNFYLVGGHLIPGSHLLQAAAGGSVQNTTKITVDIGSAPSPEGNDEYFVTGEHPPFLEYWHGNRSSGWHPTSANDDSKIDKNFSIHIHFTYSSFFRAEYRII